MTKAQDTDAQSGEYADLMERLAEKGSSYFGNPDENKMCCDAYDAIDSLTEENDRLKQFNRDYAEECAELKRRVGELEAERALLRSQVKALTQNTEGESDG